MTTAPPAVTAGDLPSRPEAVLRRVIRVPVGPREANDDQANRLFSASILLSALRCLLSYVVLPVLTPLIGPVVGNSPAIAIPLSVVALIFDVRAVRRFWQANHAWRWKITAVYALIMALITGLLVYDLVRVFN